MKYHKHEIRPEREDLGYDDDRMNKVYRIYKDGEYVNEAWTLSTAKAFIDSGYDQNLL